MKFHLPAALTAFIFSSSAAVADASPSVDLGNLMYVGDSITHGVNSASYRWAMFKILTDNGIAHTDVGTRTGNNSGGVASGSSYGGQTFNNVHESLSGLRARQLAGTMAGSLASSPQANNFVLMIGTNDLLSDNKGDLTDSVLAATTQNLLGTYDDLGNKLQGGYMDTIVQAMISSSPAAPVVVASIPCWTYHNNHDSEVNHAAVARYNQSLEQWTHEYANVTYVDVNRGMIDVASSTSFYGVRSMFNNPPADGLHPNAQGDLILAGNLARGMGYAGRTAGQARMGASGMAVNFYTPSGAPSFAGGMEALASQGFTGSNIAVADKAITFGPDGAGSLDYSWGEGADLSHGYTLELTLTLGDGASGGWNTTDQLVITLGGNGLSGTLNVNEAYIQWGDSILFSMDMSSNTEALRLACVNGNELEGLKGGFYVWLGDMLIGEALSGVSGSGQSGLNITYGGSGNVSLSDLVLDGTHSYAPTTTGTFNGNEAFISSGGNAGGDAGEPQGNIAWKQDGFTASASDLALSGNSFNARAAVDNGTGSTGNSINAVVTSGSTQQLYANCGDYTGDVWLTISHEGKASAWFAAQGLNGTLNGDAYVRFTDQATGGSTVFGVVNSQNSTVAVNGNVYLEFSAPDASFGSFTSQAGLQASVAGAYRADVTGNVSVVVNSGTFSGQIIGGVHTGANTIGGSAGVYVNGGTVSGDVVGGGLSGSVAGGTHVAVTGGTLAANVYGGGKGGSVTGGSSVELSGGIVQGDVYAGGTAGTIEGDTRVTVSGSNVQLYGGSRWGTISAGGTGGSITGNSSVVLKDISTGQSNYGFDKYAGSISGGTNVAGNRTLVLDHVTVSLSEASLSDFSYVSLVNGTNTSLSSTGGALRLGIESGCMLTLAGISGMTELTLGNNASLTVGGLSADRLVIDITGADHYGVTLTDIPANVDHVFFKDGDALYGAGMRVDTQANQAQLFAVVPEPSAAALGMLGTLAALLRRRRNDFG